MSVPVPIVPINVVPMPQFIPRSRREESTRDVVNARNNELRQSGPQVQQAFFRPEPTALAGSRLKAQKSILPTQDRSIQYDECEPVRPVYESPDYPEDKPMNSSAMMGPRNTAFFDQAGIATRNQAPISIPGPAYEPNAPKLEGNPFFDQYAASYDPRNVARELNSAVKEDKMDRGVIESRRILSRGFSSRYVPEGFAEKNQFDNLQAFELLRPKIDDYSKIYK